MPEITDPQDDEAVSPEEEIDGVVHDEGQGNESEELEDDAEDYPEKASETLVERRVHAIVDGVEAASMAAIEEVRKLVEGDESEEMLQLMFETLNSVYEMLAAAGVQKKYKVLDRPEEYDSYEAVKAAIGDSLVFPTEFFRLEEGAQISTQLLAVACATSKKVDLSYDDRAIALKDDILQMVLEVLDHNVERKLKGYETKTIVPLDLNEEMLFLEYLRGFLPHEDVDAILGKVMEALHYQRQVDEVKEDPSKEGLGEYLGHLEARGKFQQLLDYREAHPNTRLYGNEGEHVMNARIKKACFIDFDENGMPYSNDVTPQYEWADFREYRRMFFEARNVPEQLAIMKRASVAELLRKLVSKDLDYGESQDVDTTEVGLYTEPLDQRYIRMITSGLDHAFSRTREPLPVLFEPLEDMLEKQMRRYSTVLEKRLAGRFQMLGPRIKTLASTLLKMLKEGKTTATSITDLVGFTALAHTEAEAEQLYAEIKASMVPGDIKEALTWETPTKRGYRSMDITGVPKGFQARIQVQCRTMALDEKNTGTLANHDAYKVFSGNDLLSKIEADPNKYLDQLYQIVHNLRCAYGLMQQESSHSPAVILENYGIDFGGPMSIVRTKSLY